MASSFLYVPADRPALFDKAMSSGSDAVIFDLEDAVSPAGKGTARRVLSAYFEGLAGDNNAAGAPTSEVWVRINPVGSNKSGESDQVLADLQSCAFPVLVGVLLAKCENLGQLERVWEVLQVVFEERSLGKIPQISPLVETPLGILNLRQLCESRICNQLHIGEADLGSSVGIDPSNNDGFLAVRSSLVMTSAAFGLYPPIGPVMIDFKDLDSFRASSIYLKSLGFHGRPCVHPSQVSIVNEVFHPSRQEITKAENLIALYRSQKNRGSGVFVGEDGKMIDIAIVRSAMRLLSLC